MKLNRLHKMIVMIAVIWALTFPGIYKAYADALNPNDFISLGPLPSGSFTIHTDSLTYNGLPGGIVYDPDGGDSLTIAVFVFDGGNMLASGDTITAVGSRRLALLFQGSFTVSGYIDGNGTNGRDSYTDSTGSFGGWGGLGGPGGYRGGSGNEWCVSEDGEGLGGGGAGIGSAAVSGVGSGGGGGFGGDGADAGDISGGTGGNKYSDLRSRLQGGSGGGGGGSQCSGPSIFNKGGGGGGGGGAIEVGALHNLDFIGGKIMVNGGDGGISVLANKHNGGGGSGGGIFLHAYTIKLDTNTVLEAEGGTGLNSSGGGGGGHILVLTNPNGEFSNMTMPNAISVYNDHPSQPQPGDSGVVEIDTDINIGEPPTAIDHSVTKNLPISYMLESNYPNPFNPITTIEYALPKAGPVTIRIYNMLGQVVATLVDDFQTAGFHHVQWRGTNQAGQAVASGLYFYRMRAGDILQTKAMLLTK